MPNEKKDILIQNIEERKMILGINLDNRNTSKIGIAYSRFLGDSNVLDVVLIILLPYR